MMNFSKTHHPSHSKILPTVILLCLFGLGALVRLIDLTDPPIDFHPSRQLRNAIVARGLYYSWLPQSEPAKRDLALSLMSAAGRYEPPILETLTALTYLAIGEEALWVGRLFSILFWLIGGLGLFLLAQRMTANSGALVALGYYLLLPFAIQASRSIQPDPFMVMWIILTVYYLCRWLETPRWKWAILSGLCGGMALLVKIVAGYIVAGAAIATVLSLQSSDVAQEKGVLRHFLHRVWSLVCRPQVWVMAMLMVTPAALYYLFGRPDRASEYFVSWTLSLLSLIFSPSFYVRWLSFAGTWLGLTLIVLAWIGVIIAGSPARGMLLGLWLGYGIYGLSLPYQMTTHSYYHLQLVPIVALSLAPLAQAVIELIARQTPFWRVAFAFVALLAVVYPAWVGRSLLVAEDFRGEPAYWRSVGQALPQDGKIIALTNDYGYRLMYYGWRKVDLWPSSGEQTLSELRGSGKVFEEQFAKRTEGYAYFVVTAMGQLEKQPELRRRLFEHYPLIGQGDGYLVFDLRSPIE